MLLTADWHLVDTPSEEYRWKVFENLAELVWQTRDKRIFILGDLCDRKDRHSAELTNRLIRELNDLTKLGCEVTILMGNHDMPVSGTPYWEVLNLVKGDIEFVTKPMEQVTSNGTRIVLLPYSAAPDTDWAEYIDNKWRGVDMIFMHQPIDGVLTENGTRYHTEQRLPLPKNIPIYSGDIHTPQTLGNIVYVGAPHPVKFGDMYRCRMLQVDRTGMPRKFFFNHVHRKLILRGSSLAEIKAQTDVRPGWQAKVEFTLPIAEVEKWPGIQADFRLWANDSRFTIVSMEAIVELGQVSAKRLGLAMDSNAEILQAFAEAEGIAGRVLKVGLTILNEVEHGP